ncbi:MAG: hypothetical protein ACK53T_11310, partial [Planctomycetota bacterium]
RGSVQAGGCGRVDGVRVGGRSAQVGPGSSGTGAWTSCTRNPALPYGAFFTAREWGKFGLLVLDGGKHGEQQIVPKEHFAECFVGSKANPEYGLNFWLIGARAHRHNERIPADTVTAAGMYDQKLYLMPSQKMLVVRFGRTGVKSKFHDLGFLDSLFGE